MKINDQDIARVAQELRDEENEQLHVRPWIKDEKLERVKGEKAKSHSSSSIQPFNFSTFAKWVVAVPAAAFVGFVLGLWTQAYKQSDAPLTALVDTIFIEVPTPFVGTNHDAPAAPSATSAPVPKQTPRAKQALGRPASDDCIRYDLLVCY